jgi:hypothetical protein
MAIMNGLTPVRGRLGSTGFRQQTVRTGRAGSGTYRRRTVAFPIQETVTNPNAPGQQRQRTSFALVVALGSALNAKGILPNFYPSGSGLGNFQKFVSDNVLTLGAGGSIVQNPNNSADVYVDFRYLKITRGSITVPIEVYQGNAADTDCDCSRTLAWSFDATQGWPTPYSDWKLLLVGIKIDSTGAIEDIVQSQPCATIDQCLATVTLPKCDCCKTYWYGFFVNPVTGYNTASVYLGTCENTDQLPVYDPENCLTCNVIATDLIPFTPPSEMPEKCGDEKVDMASVFFNGGSNFANIPGPDFSPVVGCVVLVPDFSPTLLTFTDQPTYSIILNMDNRVDNSEQEVRISDGVTAWSRVFNNLEGSDDPAIIIDDLTNTFMSLPLAYSVTGISQRPGQPNEYEVIFNAPTGTVVQNSGQQVSPNPGSILSGLSVRLANLDADRVKLAWLDSSNVETELYNGRASAFLPGYVFNDGPYPTVKLTGIDGTNGREYTYAWDGTKYNLVNNIIIDVLVIS